MGDSLILQQQLKESVAHGRSSIANMTVCDDSSAIVSALWGVMQYAPACRDAAWAEELTAATQLLASQNSSVISADVVHTVVTKIKINLDMVQANSKAHYQYLHHVDTEEHKCYEASSATKFASKGI